jgi:periplasmic protein TonB
MVLAHSHPQTQTLRLNPYRILGMAGAIAVNTAALMLLLVPVSPPQILDTSDNRRTIFEFIDPKKEPPPKPIEEVKVEKPQPRNTAPVAQPRPQPVADVPVMVADATEYVEPVVDPVPDPGPIAPPVDTGPLESSQLQYASAPPPAYPRESLLAGDEGTVVLRVLVDIDGTPLSVEIKQSSGHRRLDDAARRQVLRKWRFRPAMRDGAAVQVYGIVPLTFSLDRQ